MAYEVTATRRRPQAFDSLAGQEFVAQTLKNTIEAKRIAHAYLFSGPRGCGKTSTARILAKALNCANGPTANPCGVCPQCQEITKGISPDVIEIDGASNTSVNDVREIKEEVMYAPQSSKYKIYIIDEVHMLSTSAFNALLKTIEEPPEHVVFIFATTELQKVPATIKSRCQQFNFRLVPIETVEKLLEAASQEIGIKADEEALYWVARESTGSVRDAYTLFDQVAAFSGDHITYEKIRDKLGLVGVDRLNVIFEDCVSGNSPNAIMRLDEFLSQGVSIEQFISNSTDYLRSLLLIKNGITKESLLGQSVERYSVNVLNGWNILQIERAISLLMQLYRDIRYSLSPRYELELTISKLSWLSQYVSPMEVKFAIDQAKNLLLSSQQNTATQQRQPQMQNQMSAETLARLMNPTSWQKSKTPNNQVTPPQPLKPEKPLPVLDALKKLPEYQNATTVSESIKLREEEQKISNPIKQQPTISQPQSDEQKSQEESPRNPELNQNPIPEQQTPAQNSQSQNIEHQNQVQNSQTSNFENTISVQNPQSQDIQVQNQNVPSFENLNPVQNPQNQNIQVQNKNVPSFENLNPVQNPQNQNIQVQNQNVPTFENLNPIQNLQNLNFSSQQVVNISLREENKFDEIDEKDLKKFVTDMIYTRDGVLAAAFLQTKNWKKLQNAISIEVESQFQKDTFERERAKILNTFEKIFKKRIAFEIVLNKVEHIDPKENAPEPVKLLLSTFRGEIIGFSDKNNVQKQNSNDENENIEIQIQSTEPNDEELEQQSIAESFESDENFDNFND